MVALTHFPQALSQQQPGISGFGFNASSGQSRFFKVEKSDQPKVCEYSYHEMNIIVEGEMTVSYSEGNVVDAKAGDVLHFPKGSVITFNSNSRGVGLFCGQRHQNEA